MASAVAAAVAVMAFKLAGVNTQGWSGGITGDVGGIVGAVMHRKSRKTLVKFRNPDQTRSQDGSRNVP